MSLPHLPILLVTVAVAVGQRQSPCPDTFTYTSAPEEGKWHGLINLSTDEELRGLWLRIKLDNPAEALVNWFGESTTKDNVDFLIKNPQYKLEPGPPVSLRFYVKYNTSQPLPDLTEIRMNGKTVCSVNNDEVAEKSTHPPYISKNVSDRSKGNQQVNENLAGNSVQTSADTNRNIDLKLARQPHDNSDYFSGDFPLLRPQNTNVATITSLNSQQDNVRCGTVSKLASPLITSGFRTQEGQWPWHIAIYRSEGIQLTYICGANLITRRYVLTAAHCVTRPGTVKPSNVQGLLLYLGAHNLRNFGPGIQVMQISEITVNPDYNSMFYQNDLALLKMSRSVEITDYVRPVCVWNGDPGLDDVVGKLGTVVGWGFDQNRKITEDLMQAKMPVVTTTTCIYSNPDFFSRFTSETSYCAGFRNGTSVCNGDSGGGMTFLTDGTGPEKTWHLRGVVSISLPLQGQTMCDPSHYVVFADVAKHLNWIRDEIKK